MQKPAQLKIVDQYGVEKRLALAKPVFTIGRKPENDLQLISSSVSRHHGEIVYENDTYYLVDKGSTGGTFLNGQRVERHPLKHMDVLRFGGMDDCNIQFFDDTVAEDKESSASTAPLSASAERRMAASAQDELKKLAKFVEVNQAFKFSMSPDDVLCLIVDAAIEMTQAERGLIMLKNKEGQLEFKVGRDKKRCHLTSDFAYSHTVVEDAFKNNRSVFVTDSESGNAFSNQQSVMALNLHTIICIPLRYFRMSDNMDSTSMGKQDVIGVLYVDSRSVSGALSKTSITLLESLAFEASKSLENVRLMEEEREKRKLEREFAMARDVQVALLPETFSPPAHLDVAANSIPCRYVGGDFYDLMTLEDGRAVLMLGDVAGKGISAALLASMAQGVVQTQLNLSLPLGDIINNLNQVLVQKSASNRFMTFFCAELDKDGTLTYVNAGHNPPIIIRANGQTETLGTEFMPIGMFDFARYEASQIKLGPGDVLVTFSDGVSEAANSQDEMFGEDRLLELVRANASLTADQIKTRVFDEVVNFTRGTPQGDDITLVALKVKN